MRLDLVDAADLPQDERGGQPEGRSDQLTVVHQLHLPAGREKIDVTPTNKFDSEHEQVKMYRHMPECLLALIQFRLLLNSRFVPKRQSMLCDARSSGSWFVLHNCCCTAADRHQGHESF